jgi:cellulose synthase/poly-beta-1,6-N-acetylglucosamine synthase-like glycosyltransferase
MSSTMMLSVGRRRVVICVFYVMEREVFFMMADLAFCSYFEASFAFYCIAPRSWVQR